MMIERERSGRAISNSALLTLFTASGCVLSCTGLESEEATPDVSEDVPMLWIDLPVGERSTPVKRRWTS